MKKSAHTALQCNRDDGHDLSRNPGEASSRCAVSSDRTKVEVSAFWNAAYEHLAAPKPKGQGGRELGTGEGVADLFIYPGHEFRVVTGLVTNFHLPKSSLLMLVCAFAGKDLVLAAYRHAVSAGFRFYSYGDAMLIL